MAVNAPFRFARINRWVHFPEGADRVSHDVPFRDGISGEIQLRLIARTPLLVGGARRSSSKKDQAKHADARSGEVWPVMSHDGHWAIPGTSIQGLIRSLLEVASFAKLGPWVAKRRFGVRDIQEGATADQLYRHRVVNKVKAGWLLKDGSEISLHACDGDIARVEIGRIGALLKLGREPEILERRSDARQRLMAVTKTDKGVDLTRLDTTWNGAPATLVMTGKAQDGLGRRAKKEEFLFHSPDRLAARSGRKLRVPDHVWQDFLLIHDQNTGKNAQPNPNWEFWKGEFEGGNPVPVFYLDEGQGVSAMGTAQMFKLAMALSSHDMLENSTPDHFDREKFDLPSLIFGATGEKGGKDSWFAHNLKRRASFDLLRGPQRKQEVRKEHQLLLAPKPNYYPIYVRQPRDGDRIAPRQPYAAYHRMTGPDDVRKHPELAGVKVWPASGKDQWQDDGRNEAIRNSLNLVPASTEFEGCLRVHNLRPFELGALLWALSLGDEAALQGGETKFRHRLGLAKPYGAGEVEIRVVTGGLLRNDGQSPGSFTAMVNAFKAHMQEAYSARKPGADWEMSPQVLALKKSADPAANTGIPHSYMQLAGYVEGRKEGEFLPGYADDPGSEIERGAMSVPRAGVAQSHASRDAPVEPSANYPLEVGATVRSGKNDGVVKQIMPHGRTVEVQPVAGGRYVQWATAGLVVVAPAKK